jgi:hypothetical protein
MSCQLKASQFGPRNGHTLIVTIVARISGCGKQKEISNEDQTDHCKEMCRQNAAAGDRSDVGHVLKLAGILEIPNHSKMIERSAKSTTG